MRVFLCANSSRNIRGLVGRDMCTSGIVRTDTTREDSSTNQIHRQNGEAHRPNETEMSRRERDRPWLRIDGLKSYKAWQYDGSRSAPSIG